MKKVRNIHFLIAIMASVLLIVQAIVGIMMFTNGNETQERAGQMLIEPTVDRSTTSDATEGSAKEESTIVPAQGNMETPPQRTPGEMPSGGGFQGGDSFSFKVVDFYQGIGGLAISIIVLIIGGSGLVTSIFFRKSAV